ncbi:sensor histidine kinase [Corynebacterium sp.]|uniref:sensor histidine kinase n=1 Tax=Corynebacterium sp. TaxID=1720 RepID=UPI0026DC2EF5|nr:histidine kinase [Corynebacterium sp.]MDO4611179.1 histidine kinase [Corynebacterium sp.]
MSAGARGEAEASPGDGRFLLWFAAMWLLFLAYPVTGILVRDAGAWATGLALAATAAFAAFYVAAVAVTPAWTLRHPVAASAATSAVMLALAAATIPALGANAPELAAYLPFIAAMWVFPHPLRTSVASVAVIVAATAAWYWAVPGPASPWYLAPVASVGVMLLGIRVMEEHSERERDLVAELAVTAEREELARVVHDALGHSLTAITVQAQLARRLVDRDPAAAAEQLDGVLATARTALDDVRSTVTMLHAPTLADQLRTSRTMLERVGVAVDCPAAPPEGLDQATSRLFAACLREATTNVVRHAGASACIIELDAHRLGVRDDGRGVPDAPAAGHGLRGLRERARRAGARLKVRPADPEAARPGTILEVIA